MEIPLPGANELDILIVIDNSPAMAGHTARVSTAALTLGSILTTLEGGVPQLHLGVITTDLGTRGGPEIDVTGPGGCSTNGGMGTLTTSGAAVTGKYISDIRQSDGSRTRNYTGGLEQTIENMIHVGTNGCAYAQPLEAAKRALNNNAANAGFLRERAYLLVVFVSASDDCSFTTSDFLMNATTTDTSRCQTNTAGLASVESFAQFVKSLKTDPSKVLVVGLDGPIPADPNCAATPATRLRAFLGQFPNRNDEASLCGSQPGDAFTLLAQLQKTTLGIPCWSVPLADLDPVAPGLQSECAAELQTPTDTIVMPRCAPGLSKACYSIVEEPQGCSESGLSTKLDHFDAYRGLGAKAVIECIAKDP